MKPATWCIGWDPGNQAGAALARGAAAPHRPTLVAATRVFGTHPDLWFDRAQNAAQDFLLTVTRDCQVCTVGMFGDRPCPCLLSVVTWIEVTPPVSHKKAPKSADAWVSLGRHVGLIHAAMANTPFPRPLEIQHRHWTRTLSPAIAKKKMPNAACQRCRGTGVKPSTKNQPCGCVGEHRRAEAIRLLVGAEEILQGQKIDVCEAALIAGAGCL